MERPPHDGRTNCRYPPPDGQPCRASAPAEVLSLAPRGRPTSLGASIDPRPRRGRHIGAIRYIHVEQPADAEALAEDLNRSRRIALDCEAAGFHRYSDQLCLLQISTAAATYIVDPLTFDPSEVLRPPLEDPDVEIVMHGADFDLRLLKRDLDIRLRGLFDTQIAAALLGAEALGLAALLEGRFDVVLSKKYQRADWAERPLTDGMLQYAAADTHHLFALADELKGEVEAAGRSHWVTEECRALEDAAFIELDDEEAPDPITRVKGARDLSARQVTALRLALEWRDEIARKRDKALFRVVGDGPLIQAVAANPQSREELADIKGFPGGLARNQGRDLVRILRSVVDLPEDDLRPYPSRRRDGPGRPTPEVEALADALKAVRNARADALGVARGTLLSNAVLLEVARAAPTDVEALHAIAGMRRWKADAVGEELLGVIRKR